MVDLSHIERMNNIAYQNKDITSKVFAQQFKGKSLKPYGFDLPPVKQVLPTNIPQVQANELRIDNVFLLEDDTFCRRRIDGLSHPAIDLQR